MNMILLLSSYPGISYASKLDFVEYFAGCESVTSAMIAANMVAIGYEILKDPAWMNYLSPHGWSLGLLLAAGLKHTCCVSKHIII